MTKRGLGGGIRRQDRRRAPAVDGIGHGAGNGTGNNLRNGTS